MVILEDGPVNGFTRYPENGRVAQRTGSTPGRSLFFFFLVPSGCFVVTYLGMVALWLVVYIDTKTTQALHVTDS